MQLPDADIQIIESLLFTGAQEQGREITAQQPAAAADQCPTCGRSNALLVIDEVVYCVACGYASDGARGCT